MPLWIILTVTIILIILLGVMVAGAVVLLRKFSSTRGDYYTQVTEDQPETEFNSEVIELYRKLVFLPWNPTLLLISDELSG